MQLKAQHPTCGTLGCINMKQLLTILSLIISLASFGQTDKYGPEFICSTDNEILDGQLVLTDVDTPPVYLNGERHIMEDFIKGFNYPEEQYNSGDLQTKVYVSFIVDTKGDLRDFCIKKPYYHDRVSPFEAEVMRVIKGLHNWTPGEHEGKKVPVRMILPIIVDINK